MKRQQGLRAAFRALIAVSSASWASSAAAAVPAGYTGTPYQGTAQVIPGRVELANLDEGGVNVAFYADHRRENAVGEGYSPLSGDDYRPGNLGLPNICKTNRKLEKPDEGSLDFWEDGSVYPSEADKFEYYMGYAHTVDWVRVTVNVQQAGKYNVSSNWACANPKCGLSIWFNDGNAPAGNPERPLDGANKTGTVMLDGTNDYHKWRAYPSFAQVELSAGVQLMTFHVEVADHLQYGFLQFDLVDGSGGAGGTGAGGGATGGAAGAASLAGASGATGASGSTTNGGVPAGASGSASAGAAGSGASANPGGGATGGAAGGIAPADATDDGGCQVAMSRAGWESAFGALLMMSVLLGRRRDAARR